MLGKGKVLRQYKNSLERLLEGQNIKIKSLLELIDKKGYRAFLKYKDLDLFKLNLLKPDINKIFNTEKVNFTLMDDGALVLTIYKAKEYLSYSPVELEEHELLLGYNEQGYVIADMKKQVHLLISGLSGQGKSKMVNYMLHNISQNAQILVLNGFEEDYKGFILVNGLKAIESRLGEILEHKEKRNKPLYLVIEEMQVLSKNKKIQEMLKEILSVGRHYNIFVIGIIQIANKENCSFKDLFNSRLSFKQIDTSSYSVCLGVNVDKSLEQREFYFLSDELVKGYTFNN